MKRDLHVRFRENLRVKLPWVTRLAQIKDMTKEQFSNLLLFRNYEQVQKALKEGFDPNTPLEQDKCAIEWCSYSDDFQMMEILWKAGALPTTPRTEEIIEEFKKGRTFDFFIEQEPAANNYPDLTDSFSVEKLEFSEGQLIQNEDGTFTIDIPISKFILDGDVIATSIRLDDIQLKDKIQKLIGRVVEFPINPEPGYIDGSTYLRNCHNPVDVLKIKFIELNKKKLIAEFDFHFLFEFEGIGFPNQKRKLELELNVR
jgi:hypothetical protein